MQFSCINNIQPQQLKKLSDTRWACRQSAVNAVIHTFDAVLATLTEIRSGKDAEKAAEACGILAQISTFEFIVCLVMFDSILSCSKSLSDAPQGTQLDLKKAGDLVSATIETFTEYRSDSQWCKFLSYSKDVAKLYSIPIVVERRSRRPPSRYDGDVIWETTGGSNELSNDLKVSLYYPVLHSFLSELKCRFSNKNIGLMKSIQACSPLSSHFLDITQLQQLISSYELDYDRLVHELPLAKRTLDRKDHLEDISDVLLEIKSLEAAFPVLLHLLQLALTLPVSTAKCERTFSSLKGLKRT